MARRGLGYTRTWRRNGRWAQLTRHAAGGYTLAMGWEGELRARHVLEFSAHAHVIAYRDSWLDG